MSTIEQQLNILRNTKSKLRQAIIDKGQEVSADASFDSYSEKVIDIYTGPDTMDATAESSQILSGQIAYVQGEKVVGTMQTVSNKTVSPSINDTTEVAVNAFTEKVTTPSIKDSIYENTVPNLVYHKAIGGSSYTSLSCEIDATIGKRIIVEVVGGPNITITEGYELLYSKEIPCNIEEQNTHQTLYVYTKIAQNNKETFTVNQPIDSRLYITMICLDTAQEYEVKYEYSLAAHTEDGVPMGCNINKQILKSDIAISSHIWGREDTGNYENDVYTRVVSGTTLKTNEAVSARLYTVYVTNDSPEMWFEYGLSQDYVVILLRKTNILDPNNIRGNVKLLDIQGTFTSDATAAAADIKIGKTAYVNGEKITGSMMEGEYLYYTPSTEDIEIPAGYTRGGKVWGDKDLVAENIKEGITLFDVEGTYKGLDTSDGTATKEQILEGQVAYVNDERLTGTMKNHGEVSITPSNVDQVLEAGYSDKVTIIGDANLIKENIKSGITMFGVEGTFDNTLDTSDATASVEDILYGKTAYLADGTLATGTMPNGGAIYGHKFREWGHDANQTYISIYPTKGYYNGTSHTAAIYIPLKSQWSSATSEHKRFINELFTELGITPEILKAGTSLYTISGTFSKDATATSDDIIIGKTAYVNGQLVTGTLAADTPIEIVDGAVSNIITNDNNTITISGTSNVGGTITQGTSISMSANNETVASAIGLAPDLIRSGATILGIEGTYDSNAEEYNAKFKIPEGQTSGLTPLAMLESVESLDTSNVIDASNLFAGCTALKSLPDMNLESATSTYRMCYGCSNLVYVPNINISASQNTSNMFYGCSSLSSLPELNPISSTNTYGMFMNCTNLTSYSNLNVSYSTTTGSMFYNCTNLSNVSNINIYRSKSTAYMFQNCYNLQYANIIMPKTNTSLACMFINCYNLKELPEFEYKYLANNPGSGGSLADFCKECHSLTSANLGGVSIYARYGHQFTNAFYNCTNLVEFSGLSHYAVQVGYETSYRSMFYNCTNLKYVNNFKLFSPLMNSMFADCHNLIGFNNCMINGQTYNGVVHAATFRNCYNLTSVDNMVGIIALNYGAPTDTFRNCRSLTFNNPVRFGYYNSRYSSDCHNMFADCHSITNIHLSCTNMTVGATMHNTFTNCYNLTNVTIENFVMGLSSSFVNCNNLQYIDFVNSSYTRENLFRLSGVSSVVNSILVNSTKLENIDIRSNMYADCYNLTEIGNVNINTIYANYTFANCYNLSNFSGTSLYDACYLSHTFINCTGMVDMNYISNWSTTNTNYNLSNTFAGCINLAYVQSLDVSNYNGTGTICPFGHYNAIVANAFTPLYNLVYFGGFNNIGLNYGTLTTANSTSAAVDITGAPNLSYQSILNVTTNLANLYNVFNISEGSTLNYPQLVHMSNHQYAKLSETDITNVQNLGWNIEVHNYEIV